MSIETALNALNTPSPAPVQPQAISQKEVAAATVEQSTNAKNDVKIADSATESKTDSGVEAKTTEAPAPKTEEPLSAKFSALAKKEKAIVKQAQEIKAKEASFAEREAKIAAREAKIKESESLWDTDVFKALEARGYDYTKLTNLMLEGKTVAPESQDPNVLAKKTIEQFKAEQKARDEERASNEKASKEASERKQKEDLEAAWESYNQEVNEFIYINKDTYELISTYEQQKLISETVDAFYQKNKRVLSVKEAADLVEQYLETEAKKALNTKKFGTQKKEEAAPKDVGAKSTKTLTNQMQPTAASVLPAASEADRMKRAMAALDSNKR